MTRLDDLKLFLDHPGLARVSADLARLARNSIRISTSVTADESIPTGTSKLGGEPDLPTSLEWPTHTLDLAEFPPGLLDDVNNAVVESGGRYNLSFVAQFNAEDVSSHDLEGALPPTGLLYFFYGDPFMYMGMRATQWFLSKKHHKISDPAYWKVLYYDGEASSLKRTHATDALPENRLFGACELTFWSSSSLPQVETCFIGDEADQVAAVVLTKEEWSIYAGLRYEQYARNSVHKLLGYSDDVQPYAMEYSYSKIRDSLFPQLLPFDTLTEAEQQKELVESRLLFQLDSPPETHMWFGRDGMLFFFMREQDLRARDFSRVWAAEQ